MTKKVAWGVLSTANFAQQKFIPGLRGSAGSELRAIASRSPDKAREVAGRMGIPKAYGSYEELLADPEIEVVYNPLPNHEHVQWTLRAAQAGKHVLCEKPVALNAQQAKQLQEVQGKVLIMEAFMVRFHPQWLRARELVREGRIGTLRTVQVFFSYFNDNAANIRNLPAAGGGALYDIGCYAIVAGRFFHQAEAQRAIALVDRDPAFKTDRTTSALVDFGAGRHLDFTVSTQTAPYQRVQLCGTKGRIELLIPFNAPQGAAVRLQVDDGSSLEGAGIVSETLPACDQYTLEAEAFSRAVRGEAPLPYGVDDAIANMRVIDALFRSETSARWETV
jgi:predicted dehydrogenase